MSDDPGFCQAASRAENGALVGTGEVVGLTAAINGPDDRCTDAIQAPPSPSVFNAWYSARYTITKYLHIGQYDIHVGGTANVTDWMVTETCKLLENIVAAMEDPADRAQFAGHNSTLITDDDPDLFNGWRNTGGDGHSLFNEVLVCNTACDTIGGTCGPGKYREWNTPVHEFGHAVEITLGKESESAAIYQPPGPNPQEEFAWSTQQWFSSASNLNLDRDDMPQWEYDYMATVWDPANTWLPTCPDPPGPTPGTPAIYDSGLDAPLCDPLDSSCDSVNLLEGRGTQGPNSGPELNEPNTIDPCGDGDGIYDGYPLDETVEAIRVYTVDGSDFAVGAAVNIEVDVIAWTGANGDALDVYYASDASNPSWQFLSTVVPGRGGPNMMLLSHTLSAGGNLQTVRAHMRYEGSATSCSADQWSDHDDLTFRVVPEPGVLIQLAAGGFALVGLNCHRRRRSNSMKLLR
jgi:hypothetical protein